MSKLRRKSRTDREVIDFLNVHAAGRWRMVDGTKHRKVLVDDRLVGVLCHGTGKQKDAIQIIDAIKRYLR